MALKVETFEPTASELTGRPLTGRPLEESLTFFLVLLSETGPDLLGCGPLTVFGCKDADGGDGEEYNKILFNVAGGFDAVKDIGS